MPPFTCTPPISSQLISEPAFAALHHAGYDAWLDHVWPAAACTCPVRLRGIGYSWADIALRLGITRQAAQQRWGGDQP